MSIYHRRVYLRPKHCSLIRPELDPSTEETQSAQTQSLSDVIPQVPAYPHAPKPSSFNCLTQKLYHLANNQAYSIIMSVITIYTIFSIDIDKAFFNVQASTYFSLAHCAAILLFIFQILLLSITKENYSFKFYFWIDCFSTLTMVLELIWVENLMSASSDVTVALSFAKVTKASRLSKIGARSSKIMKLIRLVKLIKLFNKEEEKKMDEVVQKEYDQDGKTIMKQPSQINDDDNSSQMEELTNNNKHLEDEQKCQIVEEQSQVTSQRKSEQSRGDEHNQGQQEEENIQEMDEKMGSKKSSGQQQQKEKRVGQSQPSVPQSQPSLQQDLPTENPFAHQNQLFEYPSFHNITNQSPKFLPPNHPNNLSQQMNIPEQTFHPYSFSHQSHQMISQEDKSNIEDIMKLFFTQNMNRFVEKGKLISTQHCGTKKNSGGMAQTQNGNNSGRAAVGQLDGDRKKQRNSSRLSFAKRKQQVDLSRLRGDYKEKVSRFNKNFVVQAPFSNIIERLQKSLHLPPISRPNVDKQKQEQIQKRYQQLVQKQREQKNPKKVLASQNLKVGEVLKQEIQKNIVIMVMGLIMVLPIITADTWFDSNVMLNTTANLFIEDVKLISTDEGKTRLLESFVQTGLEMTEPLLYFKIPINETCCEFPKDFPEYGLMSKVPLSELRLSEQTVVIDENITIIFSKKQSSQFTAYLNLGRSLFITILLIFCSILFMRDIENYALNPLQKMSTLINKISNNPFQALKQINEEKNNRNSSSSLDEQGSSKLILHKVDDFEEQKLQTNILSNAIIKITSLLTIGAGEIGSEIISKNIDNLSEEKNLNGLDANDTISHSKNELKSMSQSQIAVYVYVQFRHFQTICDIFGDQIFKYLNKVADLIHQNTIELGGIPIQYDGNGFLLLWKPATQIVNSTDEPMPHAQKQILAKLSILAMHSLTKIFLDINALEQSQKFYQYISQKYSTQQETNPKVMFKQNYEPHILNASMHVGESFYGSMGSQFKLQCKCIGYDIAFTRFLSGLADQEGYGVGVVMSQDVYLLLEGHENLVRRLKLRKIDQLKIKEFRFKDKKNNPNLTYMNLKQLQGLQSVKNSKRSIYTFDFTAKLQAFNSHESQIMNIESGSPGFILNKTHQLSQYSHNAAKSHKNQKGSKQSMRSLNSSHEIYDQKNKKTLLVYKERERWMSLVESDSVNELVTKLEVEYREVREARRGFQGEFYENWADALECYYAREFAEAMNQFKFLHTYNQPYNDSAAKIFLNRLESLNDQELQSGNMNTQQEESESSGSSSDDEQTLKRVIKKKKWNGVHQVVWKL